MSTLQFKHITHTYAHVPGAQTASITDKTSIALSDVSLTVAEGESIALIGPSGCGKSTLLQMAAGLLRPTQGTVLVNNAVIEKPRQQTALILQGLGLLPWKTVEKNVELGLRLRKLPAATRHDRTHAALASVGLTDVARKYPAELSGGMRQRVAIARALALDCDLLLMDEPLSALDEILREQIQDMLLNLWQKRGHTQVLVTHSIEEGVYLGQRIIVMTPHPGRIAAIIDNPDVGSKAWRASDKFYSVCREVRQTLARTLEQEVLVDA